LIKHLQAIQNKPTRTNVKQVLETLVRAYQLTAADNNARSGVVRLVDIYKNLTVLPSARRDYTQQEFARDIYLLDESGITEATNGLQMRLHSGASGSRSPRQLLRVVDRSGAQRTYYGVEFTEARR
jgi:hypothetical protein